MFHLIPHKESFHIHPRQLDKNIIATLRNMVRQKHTGLVTESWGWCLNIVNYNKITQVKINEEGSVVYEVEFFTINFLLDVEEIIVGTITDIHDQGFFIDAGPAQIFISKDKMGDLYTITEHGDEGKKFVNENTGKTLKKGGKVRAKITTVKYQSGRFAVIGGIDGPSLGTIGIN